MTYAEILIRKGKRMAAAYVQAECNTAKSEPSKSPQHLNALLDHLLHPEKPINDQDAIDWCRWLVGGGRSYDDFAANVRQYDNTAMCGLVWTADFVAFRCRTCGISQCMSLCVDCFKFGNHEGHDYNMFKSQAGGACDCGDASVMKESGFCSQHHGANQPKKPVSPPPELMCVAENMVPRIILRLVQHLRVNTVHSSLHIPADQAPERYEKAIEMADRLLKLLHDFSSLGAAMRTVLTKALLDNESYFRLTNVNEDSEYASFMRRSKEFYDDALQSLPNPDPPREFLDCPALTAQLQHRNFLEELVFWMVKYEFPEKLVCLLLKMLPDPEYKEAFTRSFVLHYSRVSMMLVRSSNSDKLSNRVVHVSVQLFSNEELALAMTESLSLLHIMVSSLKNMMTLVLVPMEVNNTPGGATGRGHMVVDCSKHVMKNHCYWPLVSDLNNVLSHPPIAYRFMGDNTLLTLWFDFLKMLQGMNLNVRVIGPHIEFEPNTYYASFSGELEASASPMWALVSHTKNGISREFSENTIRHCLRAIREWMEAMGDNSVMTDSNKASFHIPLHRYFAIFLRQVVKYQGFTLQELLPDTEMLTKMMEHPLRVQTAVHEIMCGLWVRNGLQIKGQVMTYLQCHFCRSMVDADIFLLQVCATQLRTEDFLSTVLDRFQIKDWLLLSEYSRKTSSRSYRDTDQELQMIESSLIFLLSLISLRTNLGLSEEILARVEMVSLLCMGDKTHSMLYEHMPEKCGTPCPLELFNNVLSEVAQFSEPRFEASGNMQQGMYLPKPHVWEEMYDPIYVLLRAVHGREFQSSIERFNHFAKTRYENDSFRSKTVTSPWPPWRLPSPVDDGFEDPRKILHSKYSHGLIFNLLHKAVHGQKINDFITSVAVHLLELAVTYPQKEGYSGTEIALSKPWFMSSEPVDLQYDTWYPTDWLSANLRHFITVIFSNSHEPNSVEPAHGNPDRQSSLEDDLGSIPGDVNDSNTLEPVQSMDVDPDQLDVILQSIATNNAERGQGQQQQLQQQQRPPPPQQLALKGPSSASGGKELVPQTALAQERSSSSSPMLPEIQQGFPEIGLTVNPALTQDGASFSSTSRFAGSQSTRPKNRGKVTLLNESIITLLLKLHSKYSGKPDSYVALGKRSGPSVTKEYRESRVGDACFFIEKVLDRIHEMDEACAESIEASRKIVWPDHHKQEARVEEEAERRETEMKKKKAKERQRKLMEQLAAQRKRFEENSCHDTIDKDDDSQSEASTSQGADAGLDDGMELKRDVKQYHCCHCRLESPASEDRPIGLVTLIQSTSVLAHKHRENTHLLLPTSEDMVDSLPHPTEDSLGIEHEERFQMMLQHFDHQSVLLSMNRGWKGGIHVQSCGHHMHYDCRQSYCETLKHQMRVTRDQALDTDHGEFICPVCRQMANSLLPVPPDPPNLPAIRFTGDPRLQMNQVSAKIHQLLSEDFVHLKPGATQLRAEMSHVMEFLTKTTLPQYRMDKTNHPTQAITNFISSIARTNLEVDLVQRGGSLVETQGAGATGLSQATHVNKPKFCFVPLLHVLGIHMNAWPSRSLAEEWGQITGQWKMPEGVRTTHPMIAKHRDVPLLLQDPLTLMLHFLLLLPTNMEKAYFDTITKACFNLNVVQILVRLTCGLSLKEREDLKEAFRKDPKGKSLNSNLGHVISLMEAQGLYVNDNDQMSVGEDILGLELSDLEDSAQELALPYLRIASLIKKYVFEEDIPQIYLDNREFSQLLEYLDLASPDSHIARASGAGAMEEDPHEANLSICDGLNWFHPKGEEVGGGSNNELTLWCQNFFPMINSHCGAAQKLLQVNLLWQQPSLLKVPKNYDEIFEFYHKRKCSKCGKVPKDPTVCLMCGTMVCLKENCCRQQVGESHVLETVKHAWDCGGGTGIFLAVNSSTIVVIRGKRACIWGSIYLDMFGEEDKELKRGKPLFLHEERYRLLEHQWRTHKFDHTNRKWVMHRDTI